MGKTYKDSRKYNDKYDERPPKEQKKRKFRRSKDELINEMVEKGIYGI